MADIDVFSLDAEGLKQLNTQTFQRDFTPKEILYLVAVTGNYLKLPPVPPVGTRSEVVKYHIKLKSGLCSDGFINFKLLLKDYPGCRGILARQMVRKLKGMFNDGYERPDWIVGIPDAATELGMDVANMLGLDFIELEKVNNKIFLDDGYARLIASNETILLVEDLCTMGTGVTETIEEFFFNKILKKRSGVRILPYIMYITNRGPLSTVDVDKVGSFEIVPFFRERISEIEPGPTTCPYCFNGSEPIKAKEGDNWEILNRMEMIDVWSDGGPGNIPFD